MTRTASEAPVLICEAGNRKKKGGSMAKGVCLSGKSAPFNQISQKSDSALYLIGQNSEERKDRVRGVFLREVCSFQSDLSLSTLSAQNLVIKTYLQ